MLASGRSPSGHGKRSKQRGSPERDMITTPDPTGSDREERRFSREREGEGEREDKRRMVRLNAYGSRSRSRSPGSTHVTKQAAELAPASQSFVDERDVPRVRIPSMLQGREPWVPLPPAHVNIGDLKVPAYGLGTLPFGVLYPHPDRTPTAQQVVHMIHAVVTDGCRFIDTADSYCGRPGEEGQIERLIHEALRTHREGKHVLVATKGGMVRTHHSSRGWRPGANTPEGIRTMVEGSCNRLQLSCLPLFQVHHADGMSDAVWRALGELVQQGKIRAVGLCNASIYTIRRAQQAGIRVQTVQNEYSVWCRTAEKPLKATKSTLPKTGRKGLLRYCMSRGIAFIPHGSLGGGQARDGRRTLSLQFPLVAAMASKKGVSPHALILGYYRHRWPCILHIPSARTMAHVLDARQGAYVRFTVRELEQLDDL